jgi:hypothetical protein
MFLAFCYRVLKNPQLKSVLRQINAVHTLPQYFLDFHFNIGLVSTPAYSFMSLLFNFFWQDFVPILELSYACYVNRTYSP